jgi:hypothetical protein
LLELNWSWRPLILSLLHVIVLELSWLLLSIVLETSSITATLEFSLRLVLTLHTSHPSLHSWHSSSHSWHSWHSLHHHWGWHKHVIHEWHHRHLLLKVLHGDGKIRLLHLSHIRWNVHWLIHFESH